MADDEQFSLCWNNFNSNLSAGFHESLLRGDLVDVTLAAEGQLVKAHRLILSVCSPYFRKMFTQVPVNQHAFIFLKDVSHSALKDLIQFMYCGEVNVKQDALPAFISTAEALQIKGLTESGDSVPANQSPAKEEITAAVPVTASVPTPTAPAPRVKVQRNRVQSFKVDSEAESGDDKVQIRAQQHLAQATVVASTQKRVLQQRAQQVSKRTKLSVSASSEGLDTSDTAPTQVQTVQIVKQIPAQTIEPEYIELPIESINPKNEPDYTDEPTEIETVDAETEQEQEHKLSEHDQGEVDDDGNYVEDEAYGEMTITKYDETYLTEGEDNVKPGVSGFGDSYTSDGGTGTEQSAQAHPSLLKALRQRQLRFARPLPPAVAPLPGLKRPKRDPDADTAVNPLKTTQESSVEFDGPKVPGFKFPLQQRLDVERLESAIRNSKDIRKKYVNFLSKRKPSHITIQHFLSNIFSDAALTAYNFNGSNSSGRAKISMKTYAVFYDCFIEAFESSGLSEAELQSQLTAAIKHSRNRMRQRSFRARKNMEKQFMTIKSE